MRRLILALAIVLSVPSVTAAASFTPNMFSLAITGQSFVGDDGQPLGVTTTCWFCADDDPTNDVAYALNLLSAPTMFAFPACCVGTVGIGGIAIDPPNPDAAPNLSSFLLEAELRMWDRADPEAISVSDGTMHGFFLYGGVHCCSGTINTVRFMPALLAWPVPTTGIALEIAHPRDPVFMPANVSAPEPTTLLLLSTGLLMARRSRI